MAVTTTRGFRVEDITFKNARRQSEIFNELASENAQNDHIATLPPVPQSFTPEQITSYLNDVISNTEDHNTKRLFSMILKVVRENEDLKNQVRKLNQQVDSFKALETTPDDIVN